MKILQGAFHYTKSHVFNSGLSAVKLAKITNKDNDIIFANKILCARNESLKKLKNIDYKKYNVKLNKNKKLLSIITSLSVKNSQKFKKKNFDLTNTLRKALNDFKKNPNKAIKKHLNGHINLSNTNSELGKGYIAYCGKKITIKK